MGFMPLFGAGTYLSRLDTPLLKLSRRDLFRVRDAFEAVFVFGATGSGKTSGSGAALAKAYLRAGWGGLVCCVKPDEAALWRRYARQTGRSKDLIVMDGSGAERFNFLQYQMQTSPDSGGLVMNVVATLSNVIEAANGGAGGGGDNPFWQKSMKEALTHAIAVLWASYGRLNLYDLLALLQSRPQTYDQANSPGWQDASFMAHTLARVEDGPHPMHPMDFRAAITYLTHTLANPDSRTTGNILATISADLAPLMQGAMREIFSTGTTVVPELTHGGKIIVLDFPVKVWGEAGLLAQQIFRYLWQKSAEARRVTDRSRPLFQWCDEAHLLLSPYDPEFLSTARSARVATTFLSQNYPGLVAKMRSKSPEHSVDAMLGNFQTKIFHANGCHRTNQWAADMIGRALTLRFNGGANSGWSESDGDTWGGGSSSSSGVGGQTSVSQNYGRSRTRSQSGGQSVGYSEQMDFQVQPATFTRLRKGGKVNRGKVDGLIFQAGRVFAHSGRTYLPAVFNQG